MPLESMSDFFTARVAGYDVHMLTEVEGCAEAYAQTAAHLPADLGELLDLGCGTGLELAPIFARFPRVAVTGVDITPAMLDQLRAKYPDRAVKLICGSYFDVDFGVAHYDAAVAVETLHHFPAAQKVGLYARIRNALKPGGVFLDCDYLADTDAEEARFFAENARLCAEAHVAPGAFYHYDTPLTLAHERDALLQAGFLRVETRWQQGHTALLAAISA